MAKPNYQNEATPQILFGSFSPVRKPCNHLCNNNISWWGVVVTTLTPLNKQLPKKQTTDKQTNKQNLPKTAKANQTAKYPMFSQPADHPSHRTGCEVRSHHQNLGFGHLNLQSKVELSPLLKVLCPISPICWIYVGIWYLFLVFNMF